MNVKLNLAICVGPLQCLNTVTPKTLEAAYLQRSLFKAADTYKLTKNFLFHKTLNSTGTMKPFACSIPVYTTVS